MTPFTRRHGPIKTEGRGGNERPGLLPPPEEKSSSRNREASLVDHVCLFLVLLLPGANFKQERV